MRREPKLTLSVDVNPVTSAASYGVRATGSTCTSTIRVEKAKQSKMYLLFEPIMYGRAPNGYHRDHDQDEEQNLALGCLWVLRYSLSRQRWGKRARRKGSTVYVHLMSRILGGEEITILRTCHQVWVLSLGRGRPVS